MCFPLFRHFRFGLLGAFMALSVSAFPPAPHYTIYGMVRDQVGQAITGEGAELVLLDGTRELARAPINGFISIDHNYSLNIRIDAARPQTDVYSRAAIPAAGLFSLVVEMNGALFYPIEISGSLVAGVGGERTALDLNLGSDSDNDTLPDTWEEWQLYQGGYFPDDTGWDLSLIDRDGDFDGDGQSNWLEYRAGTFASDAGETLSLTVKEKLPTSLRFEIYVITGKTYTIERTTDGATWERVPFSVDVFTEGSAVYTATRVGVVSAFTASSLNSGGELYRLTVR